MTALERALVVYAEAKGYEIEVHIEDDHWNVKGTPGFFNFDACDYRVKNIQDYYNAYSAVIGSFRPPHYTEQINPKIIIPKHPQTWDIEDLKKYKPAGFSCKTVTLTSEEIEEMNKPKEEEFDVKSLVETPEYLERCKELRIIEILESYKRGETIAFKGKNTTNEWCIVWEGHIWNFSKFDYRAYPKEPKGIPATEGELSLIDSYAWFRDSEGKCQYSFKLYVGENIGWHIFDPVFKTWQDWGSK